MGRLFGISTLKGSELAPGSSARYYKGRFVSQGNEVRDENADYAVFSELSSNPATLEALKAIDAFGLLPGSTTQTADAEQAYTQTTLGRNHCGGNARGSVRATETWVRLPHDQRPDSFRRYRDPVCPLRLALYGHPDAGGFWERHAERCLREGGFVPVEGWKSTY